MTGEKTAVAWLASAAPEPEACLEQWDQDPQGIALLPAGRVWDVLILPGELGYPTLDVLTRVIDRPGPVLVDFGDARMGFLVPPGTAARWIGTGIRTAGPGTWIVVPYPGRSTGGVRWLIPPDGSGTLTDPALLELAMHEAAASLAARTDPGTTGAGDDSSGDAGAPGWIVPADDMTAPQKQAGVVQLPSTPRGGGEGGQEQSGGARTEAGDAGCVEPGLGACALGAEIPEPPYVERDLRTEQGTARQPDAGTGSGSGSGNEGRGGSGAENEVGSEPRRAGGSG